MSEKDWIIYIEDILNSVERIIKKTSDVESSDFESDQDVQDIVIRHFTFIGEAERSVPSYIKEKYNQMPWQAMNALRNFVIHEYRNVNYKRILDTAQIDIPKLKPQLEKIIKDHE